MNPAFRFLEHARVSAWKVIDKQVQSLVAGLLTVWCCLDRLLGVCSEELSLVTVAIQVRLVDFYPIVYTGVLQAFECVCHHASSDQIISTHLSQSMRRCFMVDMAFLE